MAGRGNRRIWMIVAAVHCGVVAAVFALHVVGEWLRPQPKEYTTLIQLDSLPPAEPPDVDLVEPPSPPPPLPRPAPPEPAPTPAPAPRKEIEVSKKRIRRPPPPRSPPAPRPPSAEEIRERLAMPASASPVPVEQDLFRVYYAMVKRRMMAVWQQPSRASAPPGATAQVSITVERDGRIARCWLSRSSGSRLLDESALAAAGSVGRLEALPVGYRGATKDITVDFVLTGDGA